MQLYVCLLYSSGAATVAAQQCFQFENVQKNLLIGFYIEK